MEGINKILRDLANDPVFSLLSLIAILLVRIRVWEWMPARKKPRTPKKKETANG